MASRKHDAKEVGDYHLALQFGYLPLLRSVQGFIQAQRKGQKRLKQLIRDEGRRVRRRVDLLNDTSSSEESFTNWYPWDPIGVYPPLASYHYAADWNYRAHYNQTTTLETKVWAEGAFRYFLPSGPRDVNWTRKMRRRLLGSKVSPSTLYELMPWSWLVDYFIDLGDFIEATSPSRVADLLVCDYAFIMRTVSQRNKRVGSFWITPESPPTGLPVQQVTCTTYHDFTVKTRVAASPFGFGLKESDLSAHQWGILGALGASKLPTGR